MTDKYEYLSLRDREAYSELKKYFDKLSTTMDADGKSSRKQGRRRLDSNVSAELSSQVVHGQDEPAKNGSDDQK